MFNVIRKHFLEEWLRAGLTEVFVDPTYPGVQLPEQFRAADSLKLNLSWNFKCFMELRDDGVHVDLSFSGQESRVVLPWNSIQGMQNRALNKAIKYAPATEKSTFEDIIPEPAPMRKFSIIDGANEVTPPRKGHLKLVN